MRQYTPVVHGHFRQTLCFVGGMAFRGVWQDRQDGTDISGRGVKHGMAWRGRGTFNACAVEQTSNARLTCGRWRAFHVCMRNRGCRRRVWHFPHPPCPQLHCLHLYGVGRRGTYNAENISPTLRHAGVCDVAARSRACPVKSKRLRSDALR